MLTAIACKRAPVPRGAFSAGVCIVELVRASGSLALLLADLSDGIR